MRLPPGRRVALPVTFLAAAILCGPLAGCRDAGQGQGADAAPAAGAVDPNDPASLAVDVSVETVKRGAIAQRITAPGSLEALRTSPVGAEVRGVIEEVFVDEGDHVEAGAELFRIDPEPYQVALRQAEAGLDLARAERKQTEADLNRARTLLGKEVISQQEVDRLETNLAVTRARERQARAAVETARLNLQRTLVKAPYAGTVAQRLADEGTTAMAQPQTIVVVLQEIHQLEARATIPEAHLSAISVGDPVDVRVQGFPEPFETTVSSVGDVVDPATRTYEVKARVDNTDHRLKAGVFAEVEIRPAARQGVLLVPREALRTEEGRTRVLAVRDGRAVAVNVELGLVSDEAAEVLRGIEPGERVVVGEAARTLAPGMAVRVRGDGGAAPASGSADS